MTLFKSIQLLNDKMRIGRYTHDQNWRRRRKRANRINYESPNNTNTDPKSFLVKCSKEAHKSRKWNVTRINRCKYARILLLIGLFGGVKPRQKTEIRYSEQEMIQFLRLIIRLNVWIINVPARTGVQRLFTRWTCTAAFVSWIRELISARSAHSFTVVVDGD